MYGFWGTAGTLASVPGSAGGALKEVASEVFSYFTGLPTFSLKPKNLSENGDKAIALGRKEYVYKLADATESFAYRSWNKQGITNIDVMRDFPAAFDDASKNASRINFALDGILLSKGGVQEALELGKRGFINPNYTNRELHLIYSNQSLFGKTSFFIQNRPVSPLVRPQF